MVPPNTTSSILASGLPPPTAATSLLLEMPIFPCPICTLSFAAETSSPQVPKILRCGHSVCRECEEKMAAKAGAPLFSYSFPSSLVLKCPVCREDTTTMKPQSLSINYGMMETIRGTLAAFTAANSALAASKEKEKAREHEEEEEELDENGEPYPTDKSGGMDFLCWLEKGTKKDQDTASAAAAAAVRGASVADAVDAPLAPSTDTALLVAPAEPSSTSVVSPNPPDAASPTIPPAEAISNITSDSTLPIPLSIPPTSSSSPVPTSSSSSSSSTVDAPPTPVQAPHVPPCVECEQEASVFCEDCDDTFCEACFSLIHPSTSKKMSKHRTTSTAQHLEHQRANPKCPTHHRPLELFCRFDRTLVCTMCVFAEEHNGHQDKISLLQDFAESVRKALQATQETMTRRAEELMGVHGQVLEAQREVSEEKVRTASLVHDRFEELVQLLRAREDQLIANIERHCAYKQRKLEAQAEKLTAAVTNMTAVSTKIAGMSGLSDPEITKNAGRMGEEAYEAFHSGTLLPRTVCVETNIIIHLPSDGAMEEAIRTFGHVGLLSAPVWDKVLERTDVSARVSWKALKGAAQYEVQARIEAIEKDGRPQPESREVAEKWKDYRTVFTGTDLSAEVRNLIPGRTFLLKVRAVSHGEAQSEWSAWIAVIAREASSLLAPSQASAAPALPVAAAGSLGSASSSLSHTLPARFGGPSTSSSSAFANVGACTFPSFPSTGTLGSAPPKAGFAFTTVSSLPPPSATPAFACPSSPCSKAAAAAAVINSPSTFGTSSSAATASAAPFSFGSKAPPLPVSSYTPATTAAFPLAFSTTASAAPLPVLAFNSKAAQTPPREARPAAFCLSSSAAPAKK